MLILKRLGVSRDSNTSFVHPRPSPEKIFECFLEVTAPIPTGGGKIVLLYRLIVQKVVRFSQMNYLTLEILGILFLLSCDSQWKLLFLKSTGSMHMLKYLAHV